MVLSSGLGAGSGGLPVVVTPRRGGNDGVCGALAGGVNQKSDHAR
jgi:hypothetical protein